MYLADCHLHSRVSPDASCSMTELAEAAAEAGLDEICFTDHVEPVAWGGTAIRDDHDWRAAVEEFSAARETGGSRLTLHLGMELGDPLRAPALSRRILDSAPPLDMVIGSIHSMSADYDHLPLFFFAPADKTEARRGIADYLEQVLALAVWGRFDVLGHLTLPLRYLQENRSFPQLTFDDFAAEVETIFRTLIAGGLGIELNTNRGGAPLPDARWLRMYRRLGGEIITLGSDAHETEAVGRGIQQGQCLLRECGFSRFCTFRQRRPVWHAL